VRLLEKAGSKEEPDNESANKEELKTQLTQELLRECESPIKTEEDEEEEEHRDFDQMRQKL